MIYGIVGAPGTNKPDVASKLGLCVNLGATSGHFPGMEVPLGLQADYRTELTLASQRAMYFGYVKSGIYWHTLIDSLAYSSMRLTSMHNNLSVSETTYGRWAMVCSAVAMMAEDGRWPDLFLYIPYKGDDEESKQIDSVLVDALVAYEQKYTCINPSAEAETWLQS